MIKTHSVDVALACRVGFSEANILGFIAYWVKTNKENGLNFFDGRTWTYNTVSAFTKQFPYWSRKQIYTMLAKLEKMGAILKGNYNKNKFDRTTWYTLNDEFMYLISDDDGQSYHVNKSVNNNQNNNQNECEVECEIEYENNSQNERENNRENLVSQVENSNAPSRKIEFSKWKNGVSQVENSLKYQTHIKHNSLPDSKFNHASEKKSEPKALQTQVLDLSPSEFLLKTELGFEKLSEEYKQRLVYFIEQQRASRPNWLSASEFFMSLECKNYRYKNYALAYLRWNSKTQNNNSGYVKTLSAAQEFLQERGSL